MSGLAFVKVLITLMMSGMHVGAISNSIHPYVGWFICKWDQNYPSKVPVRIVYQIVNLLCA